MVDIHAILSELEVSKLEEVAQADKFKIDDDIAKLSVSRQRKYQLQWIRDGRCSQCGKPKANKSNCKSCAAKASARVLARYYKKKGRSKW